MIDKLRALIVFAKVIETGTFRAAARSLGLSASVVSHHVSSLEERLSVPLLYRSTRRLTLTPDGKRLYDLAMTMLQAANAALANTAAASANPAGVLRLTMPLPLTGTPVMAAISEFSRENSKVELRLTIADEGQNLIENGFDCALRMGYFSAGAAPTRSLFFEPRVVVCSPTYAASHDMPTNFSELADADWLHFSATGRRLDFYHNVMGAQSLVIENNRIATSNSNAIYALLLCGSGIGRLPLSMVAADLHSGDLIEILPEWRLRPLPVFATWTSNEPATGLVHRFVDFLQARTVGLPQEDPSATLYQSKMLESGNQS